MPIPTTYEALEELWDEKGIEFQRLLVEAVLKPITVKPAELRGRRAFDPSRLVLVSQGVSASNMRLDLFDRAVVVAPHELLQCGL